MSKQLATVVSGLNPPPLKLTIHPLYYEGGEEKRPIVTEVKDDDSVNSSGEINIAKWLSSDGVGSSMDALWEYALTQTNEFSKTARFAFKHFNSGIFEVADVVVDVNRDINNGVTRVKAVTVNGTSGAFEVVTTGIGAKAMALGVTEVLAWAGVTVVSGGAIAIGLGTVLVASFAYEALGVEQAVDEWLSGLYDTTKDYVDNIDDQLTPEIEEQGIGVLLKNDGETTEYIFAPNPAGNSVIELGPTLYHSKELTGLGNDLFIRSGSLSVDKVDQKHSIIDGGAGVDTISYAAVTSFADGLEINLKEGVSTPRGEDNGYPLDVLDNFEHAIGTPMRDDIYGNDLNNSLSGGDGIDKLFGGAGSDVLRGGDDIDLLSGGGAPAGGIDLLYGGGDADIFEFNNRSILMDASAEDFIAFAGGTKQITGGVQQFWMEGNWAYYSPFSAILSAGGGIGLMSDLLYAASVLTDLRTGAHFRFGLTTSDQLLMQIGRGRAGVMVLNNYDLDLEEAKATGNVVAYQVDIREGKSATLANLALKVENDNDFCLKNAA